jgi:DNA anti-recombination protein RmuC
MKTYKAAETKDPLEEFKDEFYTEVDALKDAVKKIDYNLEIFKISSETCQNIVRESIEDTLETVNQLKLASESSQKALQELVIRIRASGIRLI